MKTIFKKPNSLTDTVFHYCPGCSHGIVHRLVCEVIDELDISGKTIAVEPVGCAVTAHNYFDFDVVQAAHGRAPAVATGIKRSLPDRVVFTYQGDGRPCVNRYCRISTQCRKRREYNRYIHQ